VVLLIGGIYVASRQQYTTPAFQQQEGSASSLTPLQAKGDCQPGEASILEATRAHVATRSISKLMDGIKKELVRIEVEVEQGQISAPRKRSIRVYEMVGHDSLLLVRCQFLLCLLGIRQFIPGFVADQKNSGLKTVQMPTRYQPADTRYFVALY
jgi:hypothetical protein